jgi:hypothetical protein
MRRSFSVSGEGNEGKEGKGRAFQGPQRTGRVEKRGRELESDIAARFFTFMIASLDESSSPLGSQWDCEAAPAALEGIGEFSKRSEVPDPVAKP